MGGGNVLIFGLLSTENGWQSSQNQRRQRFTSAAFDYLLAYAAKQTGSVL
jgi:hypothetical protein